jgi:serine/threonine-protein kinase
MTDRAADGPPPAHLVREELARIEASAALRTSTQLRALLRHLVDHTLAGDTHRLKELALGIEVFGRPAASYDPRRDPIVRVEARRLRERLARYYCEEGWNALVDVELPVGAYVPRFRRRAAVARPGLSIPSVIALPVTNLTGAPGHDIDCDALTEDLIEALSRLPGLKVIARTTAFAFRDQREDVRQIGQRTGAATVLESSLQRRGQRYKVVAQLVNAADGAHLWSRSFAADAAEFPLVQQALAVEIVEALQHQFSAHAGAQGWTPARASLAARVTADAQARDLHDRARAALRRFREDTQRLALELFRAALARDPRFALAHSGAGAALTNLAALGWEPAGVALPAAREHARQALAIDPELYEALSVDALVALRHDRDVERARARYAEGLRLNPSATYLRLGYAWLLTFAGELAAAARQFTLLRELDPLDHGLNHNHGVFLWICGAADEALRTFDGILEYEPADITSLYYSALQLAETGHHEAAAGRVARLSAATPGAPRAALCAAYTRALAGDAAPARQWLGEAVPALAAANAAARAGEGTVAVARALWSAAPTRHPVESAAVALAAGDRERALELLALAALARDVAFAGAAVVPFLLPLHGDARFAALLARNGLAAVDLPAVRAAASAP